MQNIDFAHRIEKVRARMETQGLDVLVATKLGSRHYLAVAPARDHDRTTPRHQSAVSLTTTSIDSERVAYDTWIKNVRPWELALRGPSMAEVVAQIISDGDQGRPTGVRIVRSSSEGPDDLGPHVRLCTRAYRRPSLGCVQQRREILVSAGTSGNGSNHDSYSHRRGRPLDSCMLQPGWSVAAISLVYQ